MKKYLIFLGVVALASCKKYLDVNINPNTATVTSANLVFTNALKVSADIQVGGLHSLGSTWSGLWAHSTSFTGGGQEKTYVFTNNDFNFFDGLFDNLADYQYVIDHAVADGYPHLVGAAKVMKCYMYQKLVDVYGNVPYSQALKGTAYTYPVYDDAQAIYDSLIVTLTSAIADIKAATWPSAESADIFFNGNKTSWVKFANTIKLRILMRQSYMAGRSSYITTEINNILTEGSGFITNNVYCQPGYTKSQGKLNPFYGTYGYDQNDAQTGTFAYRMMNAVVVNWFKSTSDIWRLQKVANPKDGGNPNNAADYVGVPMGSPTGYLSASVSSIGSEQIVRGDASRASIIMTAAESYFMQAEAALVYGIAGLGSAQSLYNSGVQWAFRLAAATQTGTASASNTQADAAALAYYTSGNDNMDFSASTNQRRAIQIQNWVSLLNIDGEEAWCEYRRTNTTNATGTVTNTGCCPTSPLSVAVPAGSPEPVRLFYPLRENSVNGANVPAGISVFTSKIFWDVN